MFDTREMIIYVGHQYTNNTQCDSYQYKFSFWRY